MRQHTRLNALSKLYLNFNATVGLGTDTLHHPDQFQIKFQKKIDRNNVLSDLDWKGSNVWRTFGSTLTYTAKSTAHT
jgi:hypothetical protein